MREFLSNIPKLFMIGLSYITPRFKNKWLFGSNMGFSNNAKYLFLDIIQKHQNINAIWIASSKEQVQHLRSIKLKSYYRYSLMGIYHAYTAKVFCYNSYAADINAYASFGAFKVNLWHGVGIKNIEHKITSGPLVKVFRTKNFMVKMKNLHFFIKPNLFLSTSPAMSSHFSECFQISIDKCLELPYPRCELFKWDKVKLDNFIHSYEPNSTKILVDQLKKKDNIYIYMPTWRDENTDFIKLAGFDVERLDFLLGEMNSIFLLKLHPATRINLDNFKQAKNILILDKEMDIYPILPFTDILITDYSSIYYDYLLLRGKKTLLYPFDLDSYIAKSRDLAFPYHEYTSGSFIKSFEELYCAIAERLGVPNRDSKELIDFFWGDCFLQKSNVDLVNAIKSRVND